jgi:hypothetical protein
MTDERLAELKRHWAVLTDSTDGPVPELLAEVRRLRARVEELEGKLDDVEQSAWERSEHD